MIIVRLSATPLTATILKTQFYVIVFFMSFFSCKKSSTGTCQTSMKLDASNVSLTIGDSFSITAPKDDGNDIFFWSGPAGYSKTTNSNTININEVKYSNRGWYYCSKANSGCNTTIRDSIFIDVKLKQETPPCSLTNNFFSCSNLVYDITLTSITQHMDPGFNGMAVYGGDAFGYPSLRVLFNSYNGNAEPLDGVYLTNDKVLFDITQEYNLVSVSFIYQSKFFHCRPNQKLYVSHVNGKIQISICNMVFSDGVSITTTCNAKLTKS